MRFTLKASAIVIGLASLAAGVAAVLIALEALRSVALLIAIFAQGALLSVGGVS